MTNDVMSTRDGRLHIKPSLLESKYGKNFVSRENLIIQKYANDISIISKIQKY